jgi:RNA polymerase sigma-70 factor (ECF subfamily)
MQDCLVRALDRAATGLLISAVRPWLFTIVHNLFVSRWRTMRRRGAVVSSDVVEEAEVAVDPNQDGALMMRDLLAGLDRLTDDQRQVLLLVTVEGLEYRDVAAILDIPVGIFMSRLSRARDSLHAYMDEYKRPSLRRVKYPIQTARSRRMTCTPMSMTGWTRHDARKLTGICGRIRPCSAGPMDGASRPRRCATPWPSGCTSQCRHRCISDACLRNVSRNGGGECSTVRGERLPRCC